MKLSEWFQAAVVVVNLVRFTWSKNDCYVRVSEREIPLQDTKLKKMRSRKVVIFRKNGSEQYQTSRKKNAIQNGKRMWKKVEIFFLNRWFELKFCMSTFFLSYSTVLQILFSNISGVTFRFDAIIQFIFRTESVFCSYFFLFNSEKLK